MTIDLISELRDLAEPGTNVGDCMILAADELERMHAELELRRTMERQSEFMRAEAFKVAFPNVLPFQSR